MSMYIYDYTVATQPTELAVTLTDVKTHLRISLLDVSQDSYLTFLIKAATLVAEKITKRILITKEFTTYRNELFPLIQLRQSKFQSLTSFKYLSNGSYLSINSALFTTFISSDYSTIVLNDNSEYPDADNSYHAAQIIFKAGYGIDNTYIPSDLKMALLNHIAYLYENRGDCDMDVTNDDVIMNATPNTSKMVYLLYKIPDFIGQLESQFNNG